MHLQLKLFCFILNIIRNIKKMNMVWLFISPMLQAGCKTGLFNRMKFIFRALPFSHHWALKSIYVIFLSAFFAMNNYAQPIISTLPLTSNDGQFHYSLKGSTTKSYTVEYSTNLSDWIPLFTTNPPTTAAISLKSPMTNRTAYLRAYESGLVVSPSVFRFGTGNYGQILFSQNITNDNAIITIKRTGSLSSSPCLKYEVKGGTAESSCDYTPVSGQVCFASGVASNSFTIPISLYCSTNQSETVVVYLYSPDQSNYITSTLVIQRPKPILAVFSTSIEVNLPWNCQQNLVISNAGPYGSLLNYALVDDGVVTGFLDFNYQGSTAPATGTLMGGDTAIIGISVLDTFATNWVFGDLVAVPSIYTPDAANYTKYPINVTISGLQSSSKHFLGVWTGSWSNAICVPQFPNALGYSSWPNGMPFLTNSSGTWVLRINQMDLQNKSASGSVEIQANYAMWHTLLDLYNNPLSASPMPTIVDYTINFNVADGLLYLSSSEGLLNSSPIPVPNFFQIIKCNDPFSNGVGGVAVRFPFFFIGHDWDINQYEFLWGIQPGATLFFDNSCEFYDDSILSISDVFGAETVDLSTVYVHSFWGIRQDP